MCSSDLSDDPVQRQPDISVAQKRLGWQPTIALESGLQRTIHYFRELITVPTGEHRTQAASSPRQ